MPALSAPVPPCLLHLHVRRRRMLPRHRLRRSRLRERELHRRTHLFDRNQQRRVMRNRTFLLRGRLYFRSAMRRSGLLLWRGLRGRRVLPGHRLRQPRPRRQPGLRELHRRARLSDGSQQRRDLRGGSRCCVLQWLLHAWDNLPCIEDNRRPVPTHDTFRPWEGTRASSATNYPLTFALCPLPIAICPHSPQTRPSPPHRRHPMRPLEHPPEIPRIVVTHHASDLGRGVIRLDQ